MDARLDDKQTSSGSLMDLINPNSSKFLGCSACESVVAQLKAIADDPAKTDSIHRQLAHLCDACPDTNGRAKCHKNLDRNLAKFIDYMHRADPYDVCVEMHFCPMK